MKTIILGYDDSEASWRALERAATLAGAFKSHLIVTGVVPILVGERRSAVPVDPTDPPEKHLHELAAARTYLEGKDIQAEYVTAVGDPAETIIELAKEHDADLVTVGTREFNVLRRLLGQSVSQAVSHRALCDVLIVH
jgi:nucleotide-binding universal stress UspA family protein